MRPFKCAEYTPNVSSEPSSWDENLDFAPSKMLFHINMYRAAEYGMHRTLEPQWLMTENLEL